MFVAPMLNLCATLLTLSVLLAAPGAHAQPLEPWWQYISDNFNDIDGVGPLRTCYERAGVAPNDGQKCGPRKKTCYFDLQDCVGIGDLPTTRCHCAGGRDVTNRFWSCGDVVCPGGEVPQPSVSTAPTGSPSNVLLGSIGGNVKVDTDNDDIGNLDLEGVPIKLLDTAEAVIATTLTDASGNYVFYDVAAGSYLVMETNIASFPVDVSDADDGDPNMIAVTINGALELNSTSNDFLDEVSRTVSGQVLEDTDNDDMGDSPIPNVLVAVVDINGIEIASALTDSNGSFQFEVSPGVFAVTQTPNPGSFSVTDSDGGDPDSILVDVTTADSTENVFVRN